MLRKPNKSAVKRVAFSALPVLMATTILSLPTTTPALAKPQSEAATANQRLDGFAGLVERVRPAVITVIAKKSDHASLKAPNMEAPNLPDNFKEFFKRFGLPDELGKRFKAPQWGWAPPGQARGHGSGFFISSDGHIVTNNHVIAGADEIKVRMADGKMLDAKLVGKDQKTDLAVLKVKGSGFAHVSFGDSDQTRVGDWVVAVGNPFGLSGTATAGIVSARGRDIGSGPYDDFIQIDAPINRGNSGGPTFNRKGQVIGVNTAIYSPFGGNVGIGFAIPANVAEKVVNELISDGSVKRGWLGISIQGLSDDLAESLDLKAKTGALIASVSESSPASSAGLRPGDVIQEVNGKVVNTPKDLSRVIADMDPGTKVALKLWRAGRAMTSDVILKTAPGQIKAAARSDAETTKPRLGVLLKNTENGVIIERVQPGSLAAEKNLKSGDMIKKIEGKDVRTAEDVRTALSAATKNGDGHILMLVKGANGDRFVAMKIKKSTG